MVAVTNPPSNFAVAAALVARRPPAGPIGDSDSGNDKDDSDRDDDDAAQGTSPPSLSPTTITFTVTETVTLPSSSGSSSSSPSTHITSANSSSHPARAGIIAGAVIGGIAFLTILAITFWLRYRRNTTKSEDLTIPSPFIIGRYRHGDPLETIPSNEVFSYTGNALHPSHDQNPLGSSSTGDPEQGMRHIGGTFDVTRSRINEKDVGGLASVVPRTSDPDHRPRRVFLGISMPVHSRPLPPQQVPIIPYGGVAPSAVPSMGSSINIGYGQGSEVGPWPFWQGDMPQTNRNDVLGFEDALAFQFRNTRLSPLYRAAD